MPPNKKGNSKGMTETVVKHMHSEIPKIIHIIPYFIYFIIYSVCISMSF